MLLSVSFYFTVSYTRNGIRVAHRDYTDEVVSRICNPPFTGAPRAPPYYLLFTAEQHRRSRNLCRRSTTTDPGGTGRSARVSFKRRESEENSSAPGRRLPLSLFILLATASLVRKNIPILLRRLLGPRSPIRAINKNPTNLPTLENSIFYLPLYYSIYYTRRSPESTSIELLVAT